MRTAAVALLQPPAHGRVGPVSHRRSLLWDLRFTWKIQNTTRVIFEGPATPSFLCMGVHMCGMLRYSCLNRTAVTVRHPDIIDFYDKRLLITVILH